MHVGIVLPILSSDGQKEANVPHFSSWWYFVGFFLLAWGRTRPRCGIRRRGPRIPRLRTQRRPWALPCSPNPNHPKKTTRTQPPFAEFRLFGFFSDQNPPPPPRRSHPLKYCHIFSRLFCLQSDYVFVQRAHIRSIFLRLPLNYSQLNWFYSAEGLEVSRHFVTVHTTAFFT